MKSIKKLFAVVLLTLIVGAPSYACGDMSTPPCLCGDMSTPPCASGASARDDASDSDLTSLTAADDGANSAAITNTALDVFLMVLTLY